MLVADTVKTPSEYLYSRVRPSIQAPKHRDIWENRWVKNLTLFNRMSFDNVTVQDSNIS